MIPKKIHYCWFGNNEKSDLINRCILSWKKFCPDYEIVEWNEKNFDINSHAFVKKMYENKRWAFVSDYVRFYELEKHGGWYLDTDMELFKSLDTVSNSDLVLGEEKPGQISAGAIGARTGHPFIQSCLKYYENIDKEITTPRIISEVYKSYRDKDSVLVLPSITFYPYNQENIKNFDRDNLPKESVGVHFWDYSWGNPTLRALNKLSVYHKLKKILDILHIKKTLKKILGLPQT